MKKAFDKATDATGTKVREATHEQLVKLAGKLAASADTTEQEFVDAARQAYRGQPVGPDLLRK